MSILTLAIIAAIIIGSTRLLVPSTQIAAATSPTPAGRVLVERFVERSRRFRFAGGVVGITISFAVVALAAERDGVTVGLLPALAGAVAGSILAESFRARRFDGPRTAYLSVREEADYTDPIANTREAFVGVVSAVLTVIAVAQTDARAILIALGVVALAFARRWVQRRIVQRGRPALTDDLAAADDEVRRMAVRNGVARPMVTIMTLLASAQAAQLQHHYPDPSLARSALGITAISLSIAGVVWWWSNRNFGFPATSSRSGRYAFIAVVVTFALLVLFLLAARSFPA